MSESPQADTRLTEDQQLAVIGHFMTSPDFYTRMAPALPPTYFMSLKARTLYTYLIEMRDAGVKRVNSAEFKSIIKQKQAGDQIAQRTYCDMVDTADRLKSDYGQPLLVKLLGEQEKGYAYLSKMNDLAKASAEGKRDKVIELAKEVGKLGDMRITGQPTEEESLAALDEEEARWDTALMNRVPFIDDRVNGRFMLTPGMTLVGGVAKSGKSTILANLVPGIIKYKPDKKVLVISNEDNLDLVATRIACVDLGVSLREYRFERHKVPPELVQKIKETKRIVASKIVVASMPHYDTSCMEVVQDLLEDAKTQNYSAILLDYYQIVANSKKFKGEDYVGIMKKFGTWLKGYAANLTIPMVLFAQINPRNEKDRNEIPLQQRVQSDHHIGNHVHVALEIVRDRGDLGQNYTGIICHFSRHGDTPGKIAGFEYVHGRLVYRPDLS